MVPHNRKQKHPIPKQIVRVLMGIIDLPRNPKTSLAITRLFNDPRASVKRLAMVIETDPILSQRLLNLVNSPFYEFPRRLATVTNAIVLLGYDAIRHLLLASNSYSFIGKKSLQLKAEEFWSHSLACALAAKIIGRYKGLSNLYELYNAAFCHDIGKLVGIVFLTKDYFKVFSVMEDKNISMIEAERKVLGYTHVDLGTALANKWNMSSTIVKAIAYHHEPLNAGEHIVEASIVYIADYLCRFANIGSEGSDRLPPLNLETAEPIILKPSDIIYIIQEIKTEYKNMTTLLYG